MYALGRATCFGHGTQAGRQVAILLLASSAGTPALCAHLPDDLAPHHPTTSLWQQGCVCLWQALLWVQLTSTV